MFVINKQRVVLMRVPAMLLLIIGMLFGSGSIDNAQAARNTTHVLKKATTNFNTKVKKKRVRKTRIRKTRVRKSRIKRTRTYKRHNRKVVIGKIVPRKYKRKRKLGVRRLPSKARLTGKTTRRYRGLHPRLRALLAKVQRHYGRAPIISSGCRSYRHNRRVGGSRRSMHLHCKAADFKISGVSKSSLRRFVSRLPGRGGVGTYCGRNIVHLDVGPRRSWYHGCRKRRRSRRT